MPMRNDSRENFNQLKLGNGKGGNLDHQMTHKLAKTLKFKIFIACKTEY